MVDELMKMLRVGDRVLLSTMYGIVPPRGVAM
jgi:hypothetical protein